MSYLTGATPPRALALSFIIFSSTACQDDPPTCNEHSVPLSQAGPTTQGVTGQSVLGLALEVHPVTLTRVTTPAAQGPFSILPGSASTQGSITIESAQGAVTQIESSPSNCHGAACEAQAQECKSRFEAELFVRLKTQDGAFDERWPATLRVDALPSATKTFQPGQDVLIELGFSPDATAGSFSMTLQPANEGTCAKPVGNTMHLKLQLRGGSLISGELSALVKTVCDGYESTNTYPIYGLAP